MGVVSAMRNLLLLLGVTAGALLAWWWLRPAPRVARVLAEAPAQTQAPPPPGPAVDAGRTPAAGDLPPAPPLAAGFCDPDDAQPFYEIKHTLRGLLRRGPGAALAGA